MQFYFFEPSKKEFFNISNDVGRVKGLEVFIFVDSDTRVASAPRRWFLRQSNDLSYFDNLYPTAWLGPVVFIRMVE
jgi:hypothetical protein